MQEYYNNNSKLTLKTSLFATFYTHESMKQSTNDANWCSRGTWATSSGRGRTYHDGQPCWSTFTGKDSTPLCWQWSAALVLLVLLLSVQQLHHGHLQSKGSAPSAPHTYQGVHYIDTLHQMAGVSLDFGLLSECQTPRIHESTMPQLL